MADKHATLVASEDLVQRVDSSSSRKRFTICYSLEVRLIPSRIIMMMLLVVAVFLYASYSGSIVMLLQFSSNSIHTLDDLLHSGLRLTAEEFFRDHEAFNESSALRAAVTEFHPLMDGLVSVTKGRIAFLVDVLEAYRTMSEAFEQEDKCGLKIVNLFPKGSLDHWITLKKNSELKEILTLGYRKVHELGLHHREILKVYFKNPECVLNGLSFAPVGIVDCYPVMLIILFGTVLALIIFLLETIKARHFIKQDIASQN